MSNNPKRKTLRTDLPVDVWDRFANEAAARGSNPGRYLRDLLVARDEKKHPAATRSRDESTTPDKENDA